MLSFDSMRRDVRQCARTLAREKGFSLTVLAIVALCVAANVAIFAVVNGVLLKPLPFREAHELVAVFNAYPKAGVERAESSVPHYLERRELPAFAEMAAVRRSGVTIGETGAPERVEASAVTPSFFRVLGVNATVGRTFTDEEGFYGKHQVAVLSDGLWRQRYGADPDVVGKPIRVNTENFTIIGVMPPGFRYLSHPAKLWTPLCFSDDERRQERRHANSIDTIARLRPGVTLAEAQAQIDALNERSRSLDPHAAMVANAGFHTKVRDLGKDYVAGIRPALLLLQAGVVFLLLIGMVNLTNLLLVRATARAKEYCVRQALGAGRGQLARLLVTETMLLALTGGAIGWGLGAAGLKVLSVFATEGLRMPVDGRLDWTVGLVTMGASVVLGLLLAIPSVWHALRGNPTVALSVESRGGTTTRAVHRVRHALIVAQIALAFVLLAGTGLLAMSFSRVLAVNPGFRVENVITASVALPWVNYREEAQRLAFVEKLTAELQAMPGVNSVGIGTNAPFSGSNNNNAIWVEGYVPAEGESVRAHFTSGVAGSYFEALGVALREGRFLRMEDSRAEARVCVVGEEVARHYWPEGGAIGRRLSDSPPDDPDRRFFTIVGVVGALKQSDLADQRGNGAVYFPYGHHAGGWFTIVLKTASAPEAAAGALRAAVVRLDPELALDEVKTMEARVAQSVAGRRAPLLLAAVFAGVALVLAAVGIYGVLAYAVAQRQREIGVRMALGAVPEQIMAQFLGLGGKLLAVALPIGVLGAWAAGRAMEGLLFGVSATEVAVLGGSAGVLAAVAMLACFLPARRAARVEPVEALRGN
jgi:Acidobacterial duplicated orphan permease